MCEVYGFCGNHQTSLNSKVTLDSETSEKALALIEALEDIDDVQAVYHNLDL